MMSEEKTEKVNGQSGTSQGLVFGMIFGLVFGQALFDDPGAGLAIGMCLGIALGSCFDSQKGTASNQEDGGNIEQID